jgi:hypothetical protein
MAGVETTILAARPSVRTGVLAAAIVSLVTLSIATFELSMGDFPSALVLMGIVPLAALLFFACLLWSASQLLRIRKDGARFAAPFAICLATLLALQYAPLQQIYLTQNFWRHRAERDRIVERVENGELFPNVDYNKNLIALPRRSANITSPASCACRRTAIPKSFSSSPTSRRRSSCATTRNGGSWRISPLLSPSGHRK